ncbi:hypothetical protein AC249_AIPGENE12448, partial [Exaiptasia diaphana]
QTHIIEKLLVDVNTSTSQSAYELKDNISSFINGTLVTSLNNYFENKGLGLGTTSLQLEHFSLDLNISEGDLDSKYIRDTIDSEIARQLDPVFNDPESSIVQRKSSKPERFQADSSVSDFIDGDPSKAVYLTKKQKQWKAVIHFLETGTAPWWVKTNEEMTSLMESHQIVSILKEEIDVIRPVLEKKLVDPGFKSRVVRQLENDPFVAMLNVLKCASTQLMENQEFLESFKRTTSELSIHQREFYRSLLVELVANNAAPTPSVLTLIQSTIDQQLSDSTKTASKEKTADLVALCAALISEETQQSVPFETFKQQIEQSLTQTVSDRKTAESSNNVQKSSQSTSDPVRQEIKDASKTNDPGHSYSSENRIESMKEVT